MSQGRKADHLRICAEMDVEFRRQSTWLEHVRLVHAALAEVSRDEISTETRFLGRRLRAPLMITAISGGLREAQALNRDLARAAQELGLAFGLGSQRPMLEDPGLIGSYAVRRYAPDIPILGNIGLQQAAHSDLLDIVKLVQSVAADGLAVHLNPAQELTQREGDTDFSAGIKTLRGLTKRLPHRILVKETGCGISRDTARILRSAGVDYLDVAGAGGTSWPRVENLRKGADPAGRTWIDEWGIPTAASLWEVAPLGLQIVGSGGIRSGLDVAKCLVLGADAAGMALPVLRAWRRGGYGAVLSCLQDVIAELKTVMLLVGARDIPALKKHRPVITGQLREWIDNRSRK
ncbi:MAG: type 2 isopentenyl-diphosphate Delta-isomerase [Elusimicrobia bacterium]|nr:type 2 isopentenyl-diphosphate Delta-isomerase [Elusimicrobiota bacterium]